MAIALHHSKATGAAKLVMIGIANHDGDGGAWPSIATLAKYASVTPRQVQKHISALVELGEVQRHMQQGGTRMTPDHSRPNLYSITLQCPPGCDRTKNHKVVDKPAQGVSPATGGVGSDTRGVSPATGGGVSPATPEPSLEPPLNSDGSFPSTSPERAAVCWACGQPRCINGARYCKQCINSGLNTPMIECTGCSAAGRRHTPGQQHFTCGPCKDASPIQEAFDHEGANHHAV
ncbi:helix-turn-helix domain-containing protein [Paeniglutamicibacter sp. NPDC012692]|uniref:helix-turn-helix domain-containing protein n=1 Tax=Paeniglutamicibacter sp. NPDC012692 TaxID=3364388 RepID=UPI0036937E25